MPVFMPVAGGFNTRSMKRPWAKRLGPLSAFRLDIHTSGAITPDDAMAQAAKQTDRPVPSPWQLHGEAACLEPDLAES